MKTNFKELIETQKEVNAVVNARLLKNDLEMPLPADYLVAMHVEFFEFLNEVGVWKYWKHGHKLNKERVLDELADVMAFFLSIAAYAKDLENIMDETILLAEEEMKEHETIALIRSISVGIQIGEENLTDVVLMGLAVEIARRVVDATWEEIKEAYLKKSAENIRRQKEGY